MGCRAATDLPCAENDNPRTAGYCGRCGRQLPRRDRAFEQLIMRELCAGLGVDTEALIRLSAHRADTIGRHEYGHDFPDLDRDLELDGLEEGADWTNYLVWRLDAIRRGLVEGQEWKVEHLQRALRYVALAFEETRAARG